LFDLFSVFGISRFTTATFDFYLFYFPSNYKMVALPYMTRNTAAAVFTRSKTEVFGLEEGSSLGAAFERAGIVNVHDLLALSHEQIDSLNYFPRAETGSTARPVAVPINIGNRNLIRLLQSWI
jgi:hypothetical protein